MNLPVPASVTIDNTDDAADRPDQSRWTTVLQVKSFSHATRDLPTGKDQDLPADAKEKQRRSVDLNIRRKSPRFSRGYYSIIVYSSLRPHTIQTLLGKLSRLPAVTDPTNLNFLVIHSCFQLWLQSGFVTLVIRSLSLSPS